VILDFIPGKPAIIAASIVAIFAVGFGAAWSWRGSRADAEISDILLTQEKVEKMQAVDALADLAEASGAVRSAAIEYTAIQKTIGAQIGALQRDLKNAKPLPADCRPDPVRVRNLAAAIDAANAGR